MSIRDELSRIYSTKWNLNYNDKAVALKLEIQGLDEEFREELEKGLERMFLEESSSGIPVSICADGSDDDKIILRSGNRELYFSGKAAPVESILWVLYCISTGMNPVIDSMQGYNISIKAFSAPQLIFEKKLVDCLDRHYKTNCGAAKLNEILAEVKNCSRELERKAPVFSKQPICMGGYERYHTEKTGFIFGRRKESGETLPLGEFADRLFYNDTYEYVNEDLVERFEKVLEKYADFALKRFKKKFDEAEKLLLDRLYRLPLAAAQDTLRQLKNQLPKEWSQEIRAELYKELIDELSKNIESFNIEPEKISKIFERADELYGELAEKLIRRSFLRQLFEDMDEKMDSMVGAAFKKLREVRKELGAVIELPYGSDPMLLGWNELGDIRVSELPRENEEWSRERLNILHAHYRNFSMGGADYKAWFCSEHLRQSLSGLQDEQICYAVPIVSDQIVFGLYCWGRQTGGTEDAEQRR